MRISRLVLHEVACFDHLELTFPAGSDTTKADVHVLVGENGTGKSTILRAMAQVFSVELLGLARRMREASSFAALALAQHTAVIRPDPAVGTRLSVDGAWSAGGLRSHVPDAIPAFAYGGRRTVDAFRIAGLREQLDDPLDQGGAFEGSTESSELIQWVFNTRTRAAFANERGDGDVARRHRATLTQLEGALGSVLGAPVELVFVDRGDFEVHLQVRGRTVAADVLPDGLKSLLAWLGDLLMRLNRIPSRDVPATERPFALFLDEVELHLHPAWQRRVLPMVQTLFPRAQIFVATHSPFVVASADDAWIHVLKLDDHGRGYVLEPKESQVGQSYETVLSEVFGVNEHFDVDSEQKLAAFYAVRDDTLRGEVDLAALEAAAGPLAQRSVELRSIVMHELAMVRRRLTKKQAIGS